MEDIELKNIWKEYDRKIEETKIINMQSWVINFKTFEDLQTEKAKSKLNSIGRLKKWMVFGGILWILFLIFLVANSLALSKIFFVVSVSAIVVFNIIAVVVYIKHVILINEIDNISHCIYRRLKFVCNTTR